MNNIYKTKRENETKIGRAFITGKENNHYGIKIINKEDSKINETVVIKKI